MNIYPMSTSRDPEKLTSLTQYIVALEADMNEWANEKTTVVPRSSRSRELNKLMENGKVQLEAMKIERTSIGVVFTNEAMIDATLTALWNEIGKYYEKTLPEFVARVADDPADAIEWRGDNIVQSKTIADVRTCEFLTIVKGLELNATFEKIVEQLGKYKEQLNLDVLHMANSSSHSSNPYDNVREKSELAAKASLLSDWGLEGTTYDQLSYFIARNKSNEA